MCSEFNGECPVVGITSFLRSKVRTEGVEAGTGIRLLTESRFTSSMSCLVVAREEYLFCHGGVGRSPHVL